MDAPERLAAFPATLLAAAGTAVVIAACAGARPRAIPDPAPPPTAKHLEYAEKAGYPATTLRALAYGRRLYIDRCSGCHALYPPAAYEARKWPRIINEMHLNTGLGEDQIRDITRYLVALAAAQEDAAAGTRTPSR